MRRCDSVGFGPPGLALAAVPLSHAAARGPNKEQLMARSITGDDPTATAFFIDVDGDLHQNAGSYFGAETTEGAEIKGIYNSGTIAVTVPSITDPDIAKVDVDVSALTFAPAVGDAVIAIPIVALPTNCRLQGAFVVATDSVQVCFGSEGGNVVGASKNFNFLFFDLT